MDDRKVVVQNEFLGSWFGNMEYTLFSFGENTSETSTANITEIDFTKDTLYMTITTDNDTMTMPNSYSVEGDQLILSFKFNGERQDGMQPPFGGERPPFDGERPFNESQPSRIRLFTYRFEENNTILYLNESAFLRIN